MIYILNSLISMKHFLMITQSVDKSTRKHGTFIKMSTNVRDIKMVHVHQLRFTSVTYFLFTLRLLLGIRRWQNELLFLLIVKAISLLSNVRAFLHLTTINKRIRTSYDYTIYMGIPISRGLSLYIVLPSVTLLKNGIFLFIAIWCLCQFKFLVREKIWKSV